MKKLIMHTGELPPKNGFDFSNFSFPEIWKGYLVKELFNIRGGKPIPRNMMGDEGIACVHYGDIHTSSDLSIKVFESYEKIPKIKNYKFSNSDLLHNGDIVFADASEDYEGIAKSIVINNSKNLEIIAGLHTVVARSKDSQVDNEFKKYIFLNWLSRKQLMFFAQGISVYGISKTNIENTIVVLPTLLEQQKIAEILSTWDYAIELKDKLIDTQTQLQNAVIQRIKRGKLEINVNSSKWEKYRLKEIFGVRKKRFFISEHLPLYSFTIQEGVSPKTDRYNREFLVVGKKQYKITKYNDLVYNPANLKYGAISVNKNEKDVLISPIYETLFIKDTKKYNIDYFKYFLTSSEMIKYYKSKVEGTLVERSAVKVDAFLLFSFSIPSFEEQNQIAKILDTLSENIQLLKNELAQLELQKKGLMQQLLTGKIRVQC